jgi:site-specific recombinase XerD
MKIGDLVTQYVAFRQALGSRFRDQAYRLQSFCRAVKPETPLIRITREAVTAFLAGDGPVKTEWFQKYQALKGLFCFAISRGHLTEAPLPTILPMRPPRSAPYIYSREEIGRLLDAIPSCQGHDRTIIEPATLRAIVLVSYGAGLRGGEARRLSAKDVDLPRSLLTIRDTKFIKSRLVPIGQQLTSVLAEQARCRAASYSGDDPDRAFFLTTRGKAISKRTLESTFTRLRGHAGIKRSDGASFQPRLHDLRHTFAVHRLTTWYRQGADVQRLLHHLSVYLGHTDLSCTQVYLTMTPELLHEAGARFERYALGEDGDA